MGDIQSNGGVVDETTKCLLLSSFVNLASTLLEYVIVMALVRMQSVDRQPIIMLVKRL
jgi:hypothetical protein